MSTHKCLILVTGRAGAGKSTLLAKLVRKLRKFYRLGGFVMKGTGRTEALFGAAQRYDLVPAAAPNMAPALWADRDGEACVFREETKRLAEDLIQKETSADESHRPEVLFIDEIGRLELEGQGFADLFRRALQSDVPVVVAALKKKALPDIIRHFQLEDALLIDLDTTSEKQAFADIRRRIRAMDSERIGAFAGLSGLVEVGLGSMLRALKVPLKGHFLAYLQNVLLITFGKSLNGRGLFRITFISSMLKAFSPVGGTIRPMLYILLQGGAFTLPTALLGFNLAGVLAGSVLMAWLTLTVKLLLDYLVFGMAFFDAYAGAIAKVNQWAQIQGLSLKTVIMGCFALKTVLALILGSAAYFGNMDALVQRLKKRPKWAPAPNLEAMPAAAAVPGSDGAGAATSSPECRGRRSLKTAALGALKDLLNWKFVLFFFVSVLLMLFFADLGTSDLTAIAVRGLCISYVGFLALRSVDFCRVGLWLDQHLDLGLSKSLPLAMNVLASAAPDKPSPSSPPQEPQSAPKP